MYCIEQRREELLGAYRAHGWGGGWKGAGQWTHCVRLGTYLGALGRRGRLLVLVTITRAVPVGRRWWLKKLPPLAMSLISATTY